VGLLRERLFIRLARDHGEAAFALWTLAEKARAARNAAAAPITAKNAGRQLDPPRPVGSSKIRMYIKMEALLKHGHRWQSFNLTPDKMIDGVPGTVKRRPWAGQ
jgi:hypothetical protein